MKKNKKLYNADAETLKFWKSTSIRSRLTWLADAWEFFGLPGEKKKWKIIKPTK
jgi:hypothetical protein